jgi:hypothetical protein
MSPLIIGPVGRPADLQYQWSVHVERARSGGLEPSGRADQFVRVKVSIINQERAVGEHFEKMVDTVVAHGRVQDVLEVLRERWVRDLAGESEPRQPVAQEAFAVPPPGGQRRRAAPPRGQRTG